MLKARKEILTAASERYRTELTEAGRALAAQIQMLAARAKSVGTIASIVALLAVGFGKREAAPPVVPKTSRLKTLLRRAGWAARAWTAFRSTTRTAEREASN
jgi:hypothetical protein